MATSFIIKDVRIFDGDDEIPNGYVSVSNGKIQSVGPGSPPEGSSGATVISKPGHTLLPGFIDAHIHADKANPLAVTQSLKLGVTTVMDMHNEFAGIKKMQKLSNENKTEAADFKCSGPGMTIPGGWPEAIVTAHDKSPETAAEIATWHKIKTAEDAKAAVAANIAAGAGYIKIFHESGAAMGQNFTKPSVELQKEIIGCARAAGMTTVAHALAMQDTIEILGAGIDGLTHTFYDQPPTKELIQAYKSQGAWVNPTLTAVGSLTTEGKAVAEKFSHDERIRSLIAEPERTRMCMCMDFAAPTSKAQYAYDTVRLLKAEGVPIIVGSDAAGPALGTAWGLSLHHEMYLLVKECGFTPKEALHAATSLTAKCFRWDDRGKIAKGLKADLVLVEGNPVEDIDQTLNLRGVWRDGQLAKFYEGKV